jgi:hypothetical protein
MRIGKVVLSKEIYIVELVRLLAILINVWRPFLQLFLFISSIKVSVISNYDKNCQNNDQSLYEL